MCANGPGARGGSSSSSGGGGGGVMLLSHAGDVNGTAGRWNMTIWGSADSAATWTAAVQVEPDADIALHLACSSLLQRSPTDALIVWERGPLGGQCKGYPAPRCFVPSGEHQTLRARIVRLPATPAAATPAAETAVGVAASNTSASFP